MKLLGAKASKSIPKELLEDNERSEGRVIPIHAEES
jgi:hypothetical protein